MVVLQSNPETLRSDAITLEKPHVPNTREEAIPAPQQTTPAQSLPQHYGGVEENIRIQELPAQTVS